MRRLCALLLVCACTGEVEQQIGLFEPIRVPDGEFIEDAIPEAPGGGPEVTSIETASGILILGQQQRLLAGRTTEDAHAIAVRLAGLGSGWWVRPVQDLDPVFPGERDFQLRYDVGVDIPPARHTLELAAVDAEGRRGPSFELEVCVQDDAVPDNLNACDPKIKPPAAVVVLRWDRDVDLDIVVETPDGGRISDATPTGGAEDPEDPAVGRLVRDSNAGCVLDGRNSEAVVWQEAPALDGAYLVYADLFDACGEPGALLSVAVYRRVDRGDGTWSLKETARTTGAVTDLQAGGGAGVPLFVTSVELP